MPLNRKLRLIADQLPPCPKLDDKGRIRYASGTAKVKGEDLIAQTGKTTIQNGQTNKIEPIDADRIYTIHVKNPMLIDHFEALKYFLDVHGESGVEDYIDKCFEFNKMKRPEGLKFKETKIIQLNP